MAYCGRQIGSGGLPVRGNRLRLRVCGWYALGVDLNRLLDTDRLPGRLIWRGLSWRRFPRRRTPGSSILIPSAAHLPAPRGLRPHVGCRGRTNKNVTTAPFDGRAENDLVLIGPEAGGSRPSVSSTQRWAAPAEPGVNAGSRSSPAQLYPARSDREFRTRSAKTPPGGAVAAEPSSCTGSARFPPDPLQCLEGAVARLLARGDQASTL